MWNRESRFAASHPAVTFAFFMAAILGSVFFQHPAYLAVSVFAGTVCLLSERGRKALPLAAGMLPLFLLLAVINPLFNTFGETVLFRLFGRPYTYEALVYGMVVSGMLVAALVWFFCYSAVMTSDKFTCLFGELIPALSLILVMVLRLIPSYQRKAVQISGARRCVGMGADRHWRARVGEGMTVLSALTSWALEGAIVTADSMRSRGYGASRRSSFRVYTWRWTDWLLLLLVAGLFGFTALGAAWGWTRAEFIPALNIAPVAGSSTLGLTAYGCLLMIPGFLNTLEAVKWNFFRSRI